MNKIAVLLVLLALATLQIEAKKSKKHEQHKEEKNENDAKVETEDEPEVKSFFPAFAIRIPVPNFGILSNIRERLDDLFSGKQPTGLSDFVPSKDKTKLKTTTKTKNSTHGPFKTYTVASETVSTENKTAPRIISKVFKSITTLDKDKLPKGKNGKFKLPSMEFELGPFGPALDDVKGEKCSKSGDCKSGLYCDAFFGVCKKLLDPGATCTQKDQCNSKNGKYRCTWGRCIENSEEGSLGTFCDADSECHSNEEVSCQSQPDISRFTGVCMAKLEEGATCGNAIRSMFDLFKQTEDLSNVCKKGLSCRTVGFFGRKVCMRDSPEFTSEETKSIEDEASEKEAASEEKKEDKSQKIKF